VALLVGRRIAAAAGESSFRVCKSELGGNALRGRNYTARRRHQICACSCWGSCGRRSGCGGENSEVTAEQVCWALRELWRDGCDGSDKP